MATFSMVPPAAAPSLGDHPPSGKVQDQVRNESRIAGDAPAVGQTAANGVAAKSEGAFSAPDPQSSAALDGDTPAADPGTTASRGGSLADTKPGKRGPGRPPKKKADEKDAAIAHSIAQGSEGAPASSAGAPGGESVVEALPAKKPRGRPRKYPAAAPTAPVHLPSSAPPNVVAVGPAADGIAVDPSIGTAAAAGDSGEVAPERGSSEQALAEGKMGTEALGVKSEGEVDAEEAGIEGVADALGGVDAVEAKDGTGDRAQRADVAGAEVPIKRKRGRPPKNAPALGAGRAAPEKKAKEPKAEPKGPTGGHAPAAASLEPRRRGRPPKRYLDADEDEKENDQKQQRGSRGRPPKRFRDEAVKKIDNEQQGSSGPKTAKRGRPPKNPAGIKQGALGEGGKKRSRSSAAKLPDAATVDGQAGAVPDSLEADGTGLNTKKETRGRPKKLRKESAASEAAGNAVGNSTGGKEGPGAGPGGVLMGKARRGRPKLKRADSPVVVVHRKPRQARGHGRVGGKAAGDLSNTGGQEGQGPGQGHDLVAGAPVVGRRKPGRPRKDGGSAAHPLHAKAAPKLEGRAQSGKRLGRPPKRQSGEEVSKDAVGKGQASGVAHGVGEGKGGAAASGGVATVKEKGRRGRPPKFPKPEPEVNAKPMTAGQDQEEGEQEMGSAGRPQGIGASPEPRKRGRPRKNPPPPRSTDGDIGFLTEQPKEAAPPSPLPERVTKRKPGRPCKSSFSW